MIGQEAAEVFGQRLGGALVDSVAVPGKAGCWGAAARGDHAIRFPSSDDAAELDITVGDVERTLSRSQGRRRWC